MPAICLYGIQGRSQAAIWIYAIIVLLLIGGQLAIAIIGWYLPDHFSRL
jgi:hypothetical protein